VTDETSRGSAASEDGHEIEQLIEQSSFGTTGARGLTGRTPRETVRSILDRVIPGPEPGDFADPARTTNASEVPQPPADRAVQWVDVKNVRGVDAADHYDSVASFGMNMKFRDLVPPRTWQELILSGLHRTYDAGEIMIRQGAPATSVRLLTSGRVEVGCNDEEGEYCLLALRGIGDVVGEMAAQLDGVRTATVTALEPCTAYSLSSNTFLAILARHGVQEQLGRYITSKLQESSASTIEALRLPPLQRLARLIARLVELADPGHPQPLRVPMSQVRIAESLGLSRSLTAQLVSELRSGGLLDPGRSLQVRNPEEIRALAGLKQRV